jgi:hypothetical protein
MTTESKRAYMMAYRAANAERLRAYDRSYKKSHADQIRATQQRYKAANYERLCVEKREWYYRCAEDPEFRKKCVERTKAFARKYPERHASVLRNSALKRNFGINSKEYQCLLEAQGGGCAICGDTVVGGGSRKNLCVDHDHASGRVRGLLCNNCNLGIAFFRDMPAALRKAAVYVSRVSTDTCALENMSDAT